MLVSGAYRLEAHRQLGREASLARILVLSDIEAELIELDENLVRIELTVLERGEHLLRRKQIYEVLHPEVMHGGAPGKSGGGKKTKNATVSSFGEDASAKTGLSIRTVEDDVSCSSWKTSAPPPAPATANDISTPCFLRSDRLRSDSRMLSSNLHAVDPPPMAIKQLDRLTITWRAR